MRTLVTVADMQRFADAERRAGHRIGFVPTMGALHEGHLSLVRDARARADTVVVSIFVNPIQFDSRQDFELYPRDDARDARLLAELGVDVLFLPSAADMYRPGFQTRVEVTEITRPLCGAHRPGHFTGVATVVAKLFVAVKPHAAIFGAKDYQQLQVVRRMVTDLGFDVEIVAAPTIREVDGLAMSSRNARLAAAERRAARAIPAAMERLRRAAEAGAADAATLLAGFRREVEAAGLRVEYAELRDPETLDAADRPRGATLFACAVWAGEVRLIDNVIVDVGAAAGPRAAIGG